MPTIHLASTNLHKLAEFRRLLGPGFILVPAPFPARSDPWTEDGVTFVDNSIKKAVLYSRYHPGFVLADDSGLSVDALGGEPGVRSTRYAGPRASDADNRRLLLHRLANIPPNKRTATFSCALTLARSGRIFVTVEATCRGAIPPLPRGNAGFGYDPVFMPDGSSLTFAEMTMEEKDRYSHRARAVARLLDSMPAVQWNA